MTKRKPLTWYETSPGKAWPLCVECAHMWTDPMFIESVYSTAIEHPGDPFDMARRTVDDYHANRHVAA